MIILGASERNIETERGGAFCRKGGERCIFIKRAGEGGKNLLPQKGANNFYFMTLSAGRKGKGFSVGKNHLSFVSLHIL